MEQTFLDQYGNALIKKAIRRINALKRRTERTGTFKYSECYEECIKELESLLTPLPIKE